MSKKQPKTLYALGYRDTDGEVYMHDMYSSTFTSITAAKKRISDYDLADGIEEMIFELKPVAIAKIEKRKWQDVESL